MWREQLLKPVDFKQRSDDIRRAEHCDQNAKDESGDLGSTGRGHSFTPRCSATEKMSLSPRPHRFARMMASLSIVGATF